ncbi:MAG: hypothetical protein ACFFG0_28260, partial [Candidatus Thorarchaeota archaeon]
KETIPLQRKCYLIKNFNKLDECILKLKSALKTSDDNSVKRAFKSKNLDFEIISKSIKIKPKNTVQIKALMKIIYDGIVKTTLLGREGLTTAIEEFD